MGKIRKGISYITPQRQADRRNYSWFQAYAVV